VSDKRNNTNATDNRKYLFLVAFLILIGFCVYFYFSITHTEEMMLHEKLIDRESVVDVICETIDRFVEADNDWGDYNYQAVLSSVVTRLDGEMDVYAELFDANLRGVSRRIQTYEESPFELTDYPELIQEMGENEHGEVTVRYDKPGVTPHDIHIYYRWAPTDASQQNRLLIVLGISKFTLYNKISAWVVYGAAALIVITAVFMLAAIMLLCRLGSVYTQRRGDNKWRRKASS